MANNTIPPYSKVKVEWLDRSENYSRANQTRVINHFANKYGIPKTNISVTFKAVKKNANGDMIEVSGAGIENIMDVNYQRALMKEVIDRDGKVVDFSRILALDDKVNSELNIDLNESQHRSWSIKWVMVDNFLSFGENNYAPFSKLRGLTIVNSIPANQGGKTTLTIDAIKFLLHGTTTKTDRNEEVFNLYSDRNELTVRGMIDIEGEETIIERKMKRSAKKGGGWTVTNKLNYYKLLPDDTEELQNEEDAKQTTKKLRETIGTEKDFEMLVLATEKNLDDLIGLTTTESGKVLTRLIGLEILELKEAAVRGMYNEFAKKKKSNNYDVITLGEEIADHKEKIVLNTELKGTLEKILGDAIKEMADLSVENDRLLNSKENVDVTIFELNPSKLEGDIVDLKTKGIALKEKKEGIEAKIANIGEVDFDEDKHYVLTKDLNQKTTDKAIKESEINRVKKVISGLIAGGICQSCNRKLDDVDNSEHIAKHELGVEKLNDEIFIIDANLKTIGNEIDALNKIKVLVDEKNRLELDKDRAEVEIGSLRNSFASKTNDLKKYNLNLEAIELNRKIDSEVAKVKTDIKVAEVTKTETMSKIGRVTSDIESNASNIDVKEKLIEAIKKEEEVDKIYKIYIDLVGKKGISKLVLRSVLPIINSEVQRLLEDVCDFDVEIYMDDKNEVQFLMIKDDTTKRLKAGSGFEKTAASLALRCVLGKMSTLPMPNFITFDEVLGKVAPDNLEKLKILFDKIKDMYEIVFFITHNDLVKDWSDNILTVTKTDNVSKITIK
jgi:DNA repair exonuclease SbcCD ATPase subunit